MSSDDAGVSLDAWPLASGVWVSSGVKPGMTLTQTANDSPVSDAVTPADIAVLLSTGRLDREGAAAIFAPEFKYCSHSGSPLVLPDSTRSKEPWIPPYGVASILAQSSSAVRGLQQTSRAVMLTRRKSRDPNHDPDEKLPLPGFGVYEFYSIPAATQSPVLLALEAAKGMMFVWLPDSKTWKQLDAPTIGGHLAESSIEPSRWRCEAVCEGLKSTLFLPTKEGLACVQPDAIGLCFQVDYLGGGPVAGAPVQFSGHVWAPICASDGSLQFIGATADGRDEKKSQGSTSSSINWASETFQPPLANSRLALWRHASGQWVLRKLSNGAIEAEHISWPEGVRPVFNFGSPFLALDGNLWQLCFNDQERRYVYLQLGVKRPESHSVTAPRLCTGSFNFRFASKCTTAPWNEPEHGDDSATNQVVLPLLEAIKNAAVIGLSLETTQGLADVLNSRERMRFQLVLDDNTVQTAFFTGSVAEPWRMRVFVHDGRLWAYHPLAPELNGWSLEA